MADNFDLLRRRVLSEVQKEHARVQHERSHAPALLLGTFLGAALVNLGLSRADFAARMDVEPDLADALLDGFFPLSEIDDMLLTLLAQAVDYDANLLRILIGREPIASSARANTGA